MLILENGEVRREISRFCHPIFVFGDGIQLKGRLEPRDEHLRGVAAVMIFPSVTIYVCMRCSVAASSSGEPKGQTQVRAG